MISSIDLAIENNVVRKETNSLLTGIFSDQEISGWTYDIRLLADNSNQSQYKTSAGGIGAGLSDGLSREDWASGTTSLLDKFTLQRLKDHNATIWTPEYKTGSFSIYNDKRTLYSDYSHMQLAGTTRQGLAHLLLRDDCKQNTISCAIYKRQEDGIILAETVFNFVDSFTGELEGSERLDTEDNAGFLTEQMSSRHNEYVIRENDLYLNLKAFREVGAGDTYSDIVSTWEYHSASAGEAIFLTYLNPIDVEVAVLSNGTVTMLSQLASVDFTATSQSGFSLEADLGVLQVTGKTADSVVAKNAIHELETEIVCYYDDNFITLPERGILKIDSEYIAYQGKSLNGIENCIRGYLGSIATDHVSGSVCEFQQQGTFLTGDYYVKYKAIPRVDYEVTTHEQRTANKTNWLDVHPFSNLKSNKIIQIVSQTTNLAELILSVDEPLVGGTLFGPVYFGTDVANLTVQALDASGLPVEDIEVTLQKVYGPGSIDNSSDSIIEVTNSSGEIYGVYNAPYDEASIALDVLDITYDGDDTIVTVPTLSSGTLPSEIYIYQVFKHDPSLGTVGKKIKAVGGGSATDPWGLGYLDCRCVLNEDFNNGFLQIAYEGIRYTFNVNHVMSIDVIGQEPLTRFYLQEYHSILASSPFTESTVWAYQEEAEVWDTALKRGAQVILYEWSTNYSHPKTKVAGAYGPVRATSISGTSVRYSGRHLPMAAPTDDDSNLGAYVVICPSEAKFKAYARDPFTGNIVTSNEIRVKMILPNTLAGVDSSGVLPVPYGFTFITDEFNIGAGLGGSNFITINPNASGINQFTLRGQI